MTSFDIRTSLTITVPNADEFAADLADGVYCITIANDGLRVIVLDVFEGATHRDDLSYAIFLGRNRQQNRVLWFDATGTNYTVFFTPYGRSRTSAEIVIEHSSE